MIGADDKHARERRFTEICEALERVGIDLDYIKFKTPDKNAKKLKKLTTLLQIAFFKLQTEKSLI